ncbi:MAG: glycosyltransferase family 2 protein [Chloroflexota bacterium]
MKVVVPMAGRGSRFADAGIDTPKPLIDVAGEPMLTWALKSLAGIENAQMIFIILREHDQKYGLAGLLREHYPDAETVLLPDVTGGQLQTVLAARDLIDSEDDLLVANCDTYLVTDLMHTIRSREPDVAGIISVAQMPGDRWSFVRVDDQGRAVEVAEKVRISPHASTGFYYFANGHQLVTVASDMIAHGEKTRGEYYVIPVYQKYIERGWRVTIAPVREMWDMGTPEALAAFRAHLGT